MCYNGQYRIDENGNLRKIPCHMINCFVCIRIIHPLRWMNGLFATETEKEETIHTKGSVAYGQK